MEGEYPMRSNARDTRGVPYVAKTDDDDEERTVMATCPEEACALVAWAEDVPYESVHAEKAKV